MTWTNIVDTKKLHSIVTSRQVIVYDIKTSLKSNEPIKFFVTSKIRLYILKYSQAWDNFKFIYNFKNLTLGTRLLQVNTFTPWIGECSHYLVDTERHLIISTTDEGFKPWCFIFNIILCQVILSLFSMIHEMHIKSF